MTQGQLAGTVQSGLVRYEKEIGGYVLTGREELGLARSIVGLAVGRLTTGNTTVTRAGHEADTASAQLHEQVADFIGVVLGDSLLIITVGRSDGLGKVRLGEHVVEPVQVGFVGVVVGVAARVGLPRGATTSRVEDIVDTSAQANSVPVSRVRRRQ